ncbi:hypothetical protein HN51_034838 [Arachis hypogaea]|uniref:Uncharacterized protein n=1 Tax=Arachis hypogaea TaxID=3818 RepID=A0A445A714_ARAHY|nr:scarecrow-like protein 3 [Arachis ipaensis]XP_025642916.1 scarecrow-like protein 3 [Arachis hypogaea]QHN99715.1 Scarecrow-like protein [Arachis hypogaea]RYR22244.1 hypothetical protein Ahy_B03g067524 [Arachis hypogaea]
MDSGSPYQWIRELRLEDSNTLNPFDLLYECAKFVASGSIKNADIALEYISHQLSPDGAAAQRTVTYFSEALASKIVKNLPGVDKALNSSKRLTAPEEILVQNYFYELFPFLKCAYLTANQVIVKAMEGEKIVHIIDLHCAEPVQWINLLMTLNERPEGPPHLRITSIHDKKEVLDQMNASLTREAEKLDFPLQFNPIVSTLEDLDIDSLPVRTGEALAICSVLQLHRLLATDDELLGRNSPAATINLHRAVHMNRRTFAEWLERDMMNSYISSPNSALSPPPLYPSPKMEAFLRDLRKLQPKLMVITEQETNLNGCSLVERVEKALYFYSALFDCLDSTVRRTSLERKKVESLLLGEQIKNIIASEGFERKERYEKLENWIRRLDLAGFVRLPLRDNDKLHAKEVLHNYGHKYMIREGHGCLLVCWGDRPLFSISAWSFRGLNLSL